MVSRELTALVSGKKRPLWIPALANSTPSDCSAPESVSKINSFDQPTWTPEICSPDTAFLPPATVEDGETWEVLGK